MIISVFWDRGPAVSLYIEVLDLLVLDFQVLLLEFRDSFLSLFVLLKLLPEFREMFNMLFPLIFEHICPKIVFG